MNASESCAEVAARAYTKSRAALLAAYREGLGLAAVAVIRGPAGIRIAASAHGGNDPGAAPDPVQVRWWCRAADAERIAAAAMLRLRHRESTSSVADATMAACEAIAAAAKRRNVALYSEDEVSAAAATLIARVDGELARLQQAGELKSINQAYRTYRLESSARGEKVLRYAEWINKYKQDLVRQLAAALR